MIPATPLPGKGPEFPKISRLKRWRHLIELRAGQWWRRQRGIIRLSFSACRCLACGQKDVYYRLGCSCWRERDVAPLMRIMEYGWFLELPVNGQKFAPNATLLEWVKAGRHVQHPDGRRVTLEEFEGEMP